MARTAKYLGIFLSLYVGTFVMIVMPYYSTPLIPIILAPIFISFSDLEPKQKLFYSLYPLLLFLMIYIVFYHKTRKPRSIIFEDKGFYSIIYNVENERGLPNKRGFREIQFSSEPILLTSSKQMDIIPVSDSRYFRKDRKNAKLENVLYKSPQTFDIANQDTSLYVFFEAPDLFDSTYCFFDQHKSTDTETFFLGTIKEYLQRDSIYPIAERNLKSNVFFKNYCKFINK